jgi:Holliday junction resolvasome RuvABC endonuclease subunit
MREPLRIVGLDPSLNNWGIARGFFLPDSEKIIINDLAVIKPDLPEGKTVRQNSKDLVAAHQLSTGSWVAVKDAQVVFVEVPQGSQSARASSAYGICIGVLGALRAHGVHFYELTPTEVKLAATGSKTATKAEMIAWAIKEQPEAPWPTQVQKGETRIIEGRAEHMADAVAAIYAGTKLLQFKQMLMLRNSF